jgi:hypothetical protein
MQMGREKQAIKFDSERLPGAFRTKMMKKNNRSIRHKEAAALRKLLAFRNPDYLEDFDIPVLRAAA